MVMKVLIANPPAYLYDENRKYVQGGSRWSHSYHISRSLAKRTTMYLCYPFFLGYASSYLRANSNAEVTFLDACAELMNENEFHNQVMHLNPDLLLIEAPTVSFQLVMRLLRWIKTDMPDLKIAVAGYHVSGLGVKVMKDESVIDFALMGEMELTLAELVNKNLDPTNVAGLIWRKGDAVTFNGFRPVDDNISRYPFPERQKHIINMYNDFALKGAPTVQMMTSRSCPVRCNFCYTNVFYKDPKYRCRTPENIVDEMLYVKKEFGAKQIYFDDDTISINPKHLQNLCNYMIQNKVDMPWTAMADITISKENVHLMKKAGCIGLKFGVESADPAVLKQMHKGIISTEKTLAYRKLLMDEGIWAHATFTIGHTTDTAESIKTTVEFAKKLDPDSLQFAIVTPLPGTPFYDEVKANGWLASEDFNKFDGVNYSIINLPQLKSAEIEGLFRYACDEWEKHMWSFNHLKRFVPLSIKLRGVGGTAKLAMRYIK
jgi:radical SAM superfamily enzyme YgiQ (UPF0313 family)